MDETSWTDYQQDDSDGSVAMDTAVSDISQAQDDQSWSTWNSEIGDGYCQPPNARSSSSSTARHASTPGWSPR